MASVSKREWVYKGETKSAWVVRYQSGGKHRSKQFEKKKLADAFKQRVERELFDGDHLPATETVTVRAACEAFVRAQEVRLADGRIGRGHQANVIKAVDRAILPRLGERKLTDLKPVDIERWYGDLVKAGGLAPSTAKERVIMLGQICEFAVRHGWLKVSPIPEARKLLRGIPKTPIRTFKPEQVLALIRAAEVRRKGQHARTQPAMQCFLHLAAFCGLRYGEIAGLTLPRVDLARSVIEVRHSLTPWDELKGPKTISGNRNVHMPPHLTEMLRAWIADEYVDNPRQLIFRTLVSRSDKGPGGFIHPGSFRVSYWYPLLEAAGLMAGANGDNYHFHALRHFSAGWMIANGMPVMDTAQALGHKRFDTTLQVYAHPMVAGQAGGSSSTRWQVGS